MAYSTIDDPTDYFNTKIYTANGSTTHAITGVGFQPNWVWIKNRGTATGEADGHVVFDSIRGVNKRLVVTGTSAESTQTQDLKSFDSDGFTVGSNDNVNRSSDSFASWNWKAGTSVSGTTTGSGTGKAYTGSVSTDAGFSIISYTGNGTQGHTIPHHLGAVPKMFIVKRINAEGGWVVYHEKVGNTKIIELHDTAASQTSSAAWNNTTPSSTVFTLGDYTSTNTNNGTYIAYCFAEKQGFSKFRSYTGNGNADGAFIYTGFKPAMIMLKADAAGENWRIFDNKRSTFNPNSKSLQPNSANAEASNTDIDFCSSGIKLRTTSGEINPSGTSFIYMAFAESPFVNSKGVPVNAR